METKFDCTLGCQNLSDKGWYVNKIDVKLDLMTSRQTKLKRISNDVIQLYINHHTRYKIFIFYNAFRLNFFAVTVVSKLKVEIYTKW